MRLGNLAAGSIRPVLVLAGLGVVAYLFYQIGPRVVWDSVQTLGWRLPIVVFVPAAAAVMLDTLGWRVLLPDHHVPLGVLLRARLAGEAVNLTTPTASVGGEPLKAYLLRPYVALTEGFATVVVDKTTVVAGQALLLLAGILLAASVLPIASPLMLAMEGLLVVQIVAVSGFVAVQALGVFGGSGRVLGRMRMGAADRFQEGLNALDHEISRLYRERRGRVLGSVLLHGVAWATGGLEIYLVLFFLGVAPSLITALVIEAFGTAVTFASFMIPASLGALEGGHVVIFGALSLGGALGLSYTMIRRLREAVWAVLGFLWLASLRARPWVGEPEAPDGAAPP